MDISFIVSAYDRPDMLTVCLASLNVQVQKNYEVIVTDNAADEVIQKQHQAVCAQFGARYLNTQSLTCYHSAEVGAGVARGDFLCFPSDDSYYAPVFSRRMMKLVRERHLDLVYCNMVWGRFGRYGEAEAPYNFVPVQPRINSIDKTNFIIRKTKFKRFPSKSTGGPCGADGALVEELVRSNIRHGHVPDVMVVHN